MIFNRAIVAKPPRREGDDQGKYDRGQSDYSYTKKIRTDHNSMTLQTNYY
jgi:hypothetical protein